MEKISYYRKYIAEGKCTSCGVKLPEGFKYRECDPCRERENTMRRRRRQEDARRAVEGVREPNSELDRLSRMAKERGISYGQLVCQMEAKRQRVEKDKMSDV